MIRLAVRGDMTIIAVWRQNNNCFYISSDDEKKFCFFLEKLDPESDVLRLLLNNSAVIVISLYITGKSVISG